MADSSSTKPKIAEYKNIRWNSDWCKRCMICVEACPEGALVLRDHDIVEVEGCKRDGLCQMFCPDLAIEVIEPTSAEREQ